MSFSKTLVGVVSLVSAMTVTPIVMVLLPFASNFCHELDTAPLSHLQCGPVSLVLSTTRVVEFPGTKYITLSAAASC